jgi:phosphatidate cytidylyltransferase
MNDLPKRTLSAILFGIIMIACFISNQWLFLLILIIINFGCTIEFFQLGYQIFFRRKASLSEAIVPALISSAFLGAEGLEIGAQTTIVVSFSLLVVMLFFTEVILFFLWKKGKEIFSVFILAAAWLYITLPLFLVFASSHLTDGNWFPQKVGYAFSVLLIIWMNDTTAYFTGRRFGRHMISEISPKKTWEGFAGGLVGSALAGVLLAEFMLHQCTLLGIEFGITISVFGTIGDFFESALKREAQVKDSGTIMPGHGGLLDRFDAFLFAAPFAYLFIVHLFLS